MFRKIGKNFLRVAGEVFRSPNVRCGKNKERRRKAPLAFMIVSLDVVFDYSLAATASATSRLVLLPPMS